MVSRRPGPIVAAAAAFAGFLFVASAGTAQGTNLRSEVGDLVSLVGGERSQADRLEDVNVELRARVDGLTSSQGTVDGAVAELEAQAHTVAPMAQMEPVSGPGVVVVLDDAPMECRTRAESGDDCLVHQSDLQAVVNAMWQAGASGVQLMDQRLISTSAVRCVGNTVSLQGRPYSPPYEVTAVGDPDRIRAALEASPGVQLYLRAVDTYGLGWSLSSPDMLELPGYSGPVDLQYARVSSGPGGLGGGAARS